MKCTVINLKNDCFISIFVGFGIASATGFRIFLPLFTLSFASYFDFYELNTNLTFLSEPPALITLRIATFAEILTYYIPFIDNFLDLIAAPLVAVAGSAVVVATLVDVSPIASFIFAIIAGGGTATAMQGLTTTTRLASSVKTAGFGNPLVATAETGTATLLSGLSLFFPMIAFALVLFLFVIVYFVFKKFKKINT